MKNTSDGLAVCASGCVYVELSGLQEPYGGKWKPWWLFSTTWVAMRNAGLSWFDNPTDEPNI